MYSNISNPLVISYENDMSNNLNSKLYKKTLEQTNWEYMFVGENQIWTGFKCKILEYYNSLQQLPDDKIVVLTDSRDVFACRTPSSFINAISHIINDNKIIASTELFLIGHIHWSEEEIEQKIKQNSEYFWQGMPLTNYWKYNNISDNNLPNKKYMNAGLIIGKVCDLKLAYKWIIQNNYSDDQLGFSNYINSFPEKIYLDVDAKYLHTTTMGVNGGCYITQYQRNDSITFAELLGMGAYFIHIPGINISKGQNIIYNAVAQIITQDLLTPYKVMKLYFKNNTNDIDKIYNPICEKLYNK